MKTIKEYIQDDISKGGYKQKTNFQYPKATRLKEAGLVAAYTMKPTNGKLINIAWDNEANGNNASQYDITKVNCQETNDGIPFNSLSTTTAINVGNVNIIQCIFYPNVNNKILVKLNSSSNINITSGNLIAITGVTDEVVYVNGVLNGSIVLNNWNTLTVNLDTLNANSFVLGNNSFEGVIKDIKTNNSTVDYKDYHNKFVKRVVFNEDFSDYAVGNIPDNWVIASGTFVIDEDINGKFLKCTSNGSIYFPLKDADEKNVKTYDGTMTLSRTSNRVVLTATIGQICREILLTEGVEV